MHEQRGIVEKTHVFVVLERDGGDVEPLRGVTFGEPSRSVFHAVQMQDRCHRLDLQGRQYRIGGRTQRTRLTLQ
ncbi:hypothetical protein D3C86_2105970 [compost metagenome]